MIVRSIHTFLARNAQSVSVQIYDEVMWQGVDESNDAKRETTEQRSHKILVLDAIQQKHAKRPARATKSARSNKHAGRFGVFCKNV